jgi:hypothetical protein
LPSDIFYFGQLRGNRERYVAIGETTTILATDDIIQHGPSVRYEGIDYRVGTVAQTTEQRYLVE